MTERETADYWDSVNDVLDFAIDKEQEAADFYAYLAQMVENPAMTSVFEELTRVETGHKVKLQNIKSSGGLEAAVEKVLDLKIADYLVDVEPAPDMDYQQALIIAMKREQASHNLYTDLAAATEEKGVRDIMLSLAEEEARHKLRFETEYDEYVLKQN